MEPPPATIEALADLVDRARRLVVLTGAGCSTASGIPAYRDATGAWRHPPPVLWPEFARDPAVRRRYWGRSIVGWPRFARARPNAAHRALAALEAAGRIAAVVTQNVDGLHQRAGSAAVTDLHGRLDTVRCLDCGVRLPRATLQAELEARNPGWRPASEAGAGPDGDAQLAESDYGGIDVPDCQACGGLLRPDVVFFGESLTPLTARAAHDAFATADAVLVAGSSLTVFSGYRLVRDAARRGIAVAGICLGRGRADDLMSLRVEADCGASLAALATRLAVPAGTA